MFDGFSLRATATCDASSFGSASRSLWRTRSATCVPLAAVRPHGAVGARGGDGPRRRARGLRAGCDHRAQSVVATPRSVARIDCHAPPELAARSDRTELASARRALASIGTTAGVPGDGERRRLQCYRCRSDRACCDSERRHARDALAALPVIACSARRKAEEGAAELHAGDDVLWAGGGGRTRTGDRSARGTVLRASEARGARCE